MRVYFISRTMKSLPAKLALLSSALLIGTIMAKTLNFDTNFVEFDTSKMVSTGDSNYAICNPQFPSNWRAVSVNGDEVTVATKDNQYIMKKYHALSPDEKTQLESIKASLTNIIKVGPFNVRSMTGVSKLTTFDKNGGSSSMGTSGNSGSSSSSSSSSASSSSGGMSISRTGPNSWIVTKSSFQFKWQRVFMNDDVATIVYKDGRVVMLPQDLMRADEKSSLMALKKEVDKSAKVAENITSSMTKSLKNPMDFVNRALGGIFGR